MKEIRISIIMPCYNGWKYMEKCLDSFENQTKKPYEIVVCDDCSTDDSFEKLTEYASKSSLNFNIIKNERNSGPGVSRDNAIKIAKGDYVAFCDCDDWYELEFIEFMTKAIIENNSDIAICDNYITYDNRKVVANAIKELIGVCKEKIIAKYKMSLCRLVVIKELFNGIESPAIYNGEDGAIVPQILGKAQNISIVDKPLYNYYFREGSASNSPKKTIYLDMLKGFDAIENIRQKYPIECEFLGIKMVLYGATLNAFKAKIKRNIILQFVKDFEARYPKWKKNEYLKGYGKFKKIYLKFLSLKMTAMCRFLTFIHGILVRRRG